MNSVSRGESKFELSVRVPVMKSTYIMTIVVMGIFCSTSLVAADRQVSVTGTGEIRAEPDSAVVHLNVQSTRREAADAKTEVDSRVNNFLDALDGIGFKESDVTAGTLRTNPRYDYRSGEQAFAGYQASRALNVEVDNLDNLNALLDTALEQKIDGINQIEYRVSDSSALKAAARHLAIEDSKQQAMELAQAYDAELGPIQSINYRSQTQRPIFMRADTALAMESASAGRYLPDEILFSDQIDVVFDLIVDD